MNSVPFRVFLETGEIDYERPAQGLPELVKFVVEDSNLKEDLATFFLLSVKEDMSFLGRLGEHVRLKIAGVIRWWLSSDKADWKSWSLEHVPWEKRALAVRDSSWVHWQMLRLLRHVKGTFSNGSVPPTSPPHAEIVPVPPSLPIREHEPIRQTPVRCCANCPDPNQITEVPKSAQLTGKLEEARTFLKELEEEDEPIESLGKLHFEVKERAETVRELSLESEEGEAVDDVEDEEDEFGSGLCPVCLLNQKNTAFVPCGHLFCGGCVADIQQSDQLYHRASACPLCQGAIQGIGVISEPA